MDGVASATAQRPPGWELLRPCCWVESGSCQEERKENPREALSKATSQTEVSRHDQFPYIYHPKLGQHPDGKSKGFPEGETKQAVAADKIAFIFSLLFLLLQTSRSADSLCSENTFILIV